MNSFGTVARDALPTKMCVGGHVYEFFHIFPGDAMDVVVAKAKAADAHQGQEECEHLLDHQEDIPFQLRGRVSFVFTDYPYPDGSGRVYCVWWNGIRWVKSWFWLVNVWRHDYRVLHRLPA